MYFTRDPVQRSLAGRICCTTQLVLDNWATNGSTEAANWDKAWIGACFEELDRGLK